MNFKYHGIPFFRASKGNENRHEKSNRGYNYSLWLRRRNRLLVRVRSGADWIGRFEKTRVREIQESTIAQRFKLILEVSIKGSRSDSNLLPVAILQHEVLCTSHTILALI